MHRSIDCAGILKLRNSDIELRKGETDVGRKNTRVRLVFRTHLPLAPVAPPGRVLALQVASLPIECCESLLTHTDLSCFKSLYLIFSDISIFSVVLSNHFLRFFVLKCFLDTSFYWFLV